VWRVYPCLPNSRGGKLRWRGKGSVPWPGWPGTIAPCCATGPCSLPSVTLSPLKSGVQNDIINLLLYQPQSCRKAIPNPALFPAGFACSSHGAGAALVACHRGHRSQHRFWGQRFRCLRPTIASGGTAAPELLAVRRFSRSGPFPLTGVRRHCPLFWPGQEEIITAADKLRAS
jgi:hypothetical protein